MRKLNINELFRNRKSANLKCRFVITRRGSRTTMSDRKLTTSENRTPKIYTNRKSKQTNRHQTSVIRQSLGAEHRIKNSSTKTNTNYNNDEKKKRRNRLPKTIKLRAFIHSVRSRCIQLHVFRTLYSSRVAKLWKNVDARLFG